ncbi:MAG: hypothetical protein ACFB3T_09390 [Geminicoccaceae bacterium]
MKLIDADHPFFVPLWRRVAIVVVTLAWTAFEFATGSTMWGMLFGAVGLYAAYVLLITFEPKEPDKREPS